MLRRSILATSSHKYLRKYFTNRANSVNLMMSGQSLSRNAADRLWIHSPRFETERCRMISRIPLSVRRKQARDQHESFLYAVAKPQLSTEERSRQQKVRQRAHDRDDARFLADRCDDLF